MHNLYFYSLRTKLRCVQSASGIYGMVAAPDKTSLLHPVVGRFTTGQTIRVVRPADVLTVHPFKLSESKCSGLQLTFDVPRGKSNGNLTVRVCWCTIVYRDELKFAETHFVY